ncbi:MAG: DUF4388 domain-containing protein [Acidobacteria bacterium]|jgi:hypothetical protein|nr:DUF4388 domain-containing protein [Acidobacteriota bacterium]
MALVGDLKDLALVDIIQINCVGRNTARLTVHYPIGDGIFYFAEGEVVDARLGNLVGTDAVYKALAYDQGSFRIDTGIPAPQRTIFEPWANLIMEGLRLLDEARAGLIPDHTGLVGTSTPASTETQRVQNVYQTLVSDLTKIKGIDGAVAMARDGTVHSSLNIKPSEKIGMMSALLVHMARQTSTPGRVGPLQRTTISFGQRKATIFDQDTYLVLIEYGAAIRYETISPHIDRAFRKLAARSSGGTGALTGPLGGTGMLGI